MQINRTLQTVGGLTAIAIPVGYIVYKHVQWEEHPRSKRRMLMQHASFWAMAAASVALVHQTFFTKMAMWRKWVNFLIAGSAMAGAFELSGLFARKVFPYRKEVAPKEVGNKEVANDVAENKVVAKKPKPSTSAELAAPETTTQKPIQVNLLQGHQPLLTATPEGYQTMPMGQSINPTLMPPMTWPWPYSLNYPANYLANQPGNEQAMKYPPQGVWSGALL